jgi:hypothetical protein
MEFVDMCNFTREIMTVLYNEQRHTLPWHEDDQLTEDTRRQLKNLTQVKESFLVSIF